MWLIRAALRRPITVIVIVVALALSSILALLRTRIDIFPDLESACDLRGPALWRHEPAADGRLSLVLLRVPLPLHQRDRERRSEIDPGTALLRLTFHAGTDMSEALAQTISYVNRAHAFMPPGTVSPFVIRYDAGTLPVGYLVFSSESRTLGEIQDLALNRVRPVFATLPGVSSPPPFGGNQRTIVISVDPNKLRAYGLSTRNCGAGASLRETPSSRRETRTSETLQTTGHDGFDRRPNHRSCLTYPVAHSARGHRFTCAMSERYRILRTFLRVTRC